MPKRRRNPVSRLLGSLSDDTKGFVDDLAARARDAEGHVRDAVAHGVGEDGGGTDADRREVEELGRALAELTEKVNRLAQAQAKDGRS